ncbi:hypothetical protein ANTPLA_LOCUS6768 [Anthophora plagiata]
MYCERTKVVLLLFSNLVFMFVCCASPSTYLPLNGTDMKNLLQRCNDTFLTLNKQKTDDKHGNLFADIYYQIYKELNELNTRTYQDNVDYRGRFLNSLLNALKREEIWPRELFNRRLKERSINNRDTNMKKDIPRGKQKKIKALRRLLLNRISKKDDEDIQDDYIEDDDDDYSRGVNKKKMNWDDFQNEDGASVMELIALNVRHKSNARPARSIENFYSQ